MNISAGGGFQVESAVKPAKVEERRRSIREDGQMIGENDGSECAHAGCQCPVAVEGDFCGEDCQEAEVEGETDCGCGHPECRARA